MPLTALEYLAERTWLGVKLGLGPMRALLERLGQPQLGAPALLIAGTNGKGSVVALLDAALRAAGLRVGCYTSPHLQRVHERIACDGEAIDDVSLERCVGSVRGAAAALVAEGTLESHPTYFEALTAAAWLQFRERRVEVALMEVGMGGRLDATNVSEPIASAVVGIGLDHQAFLGQDLAAIAIEKAGVMRRGRVCVRGPMPQPAAAALERRAGELGCTLLEAMDGVSLEEHGPLLEVHTPAAVYPGLRPLPGLHQRDNLVVALRLLEAARAAGLAFDLGRAAAGVSAARWPGRLERRHGRPELLLDGAHNPDAARALARHLASERPFVLLFAAMADKDVEAMAAALFPLAEAVVVCGLAEARAATPEQLANRGGRGGAECAPDAARGLARARELAGADGRVVAAGSLYLVGELLDLLDAERSANGA